MNEDEDEMLAEADEIAEKIRVLDLQFTLLMARYARSQERPIDLEAIEW